MSFPNVLQKFSIMPYKSYLIYLLHGIAEKRMRLLSKGITKKWYHTKHEARRIQSILFSLHINFQVEDLDESADEWSGNQNVDLRRELLFIIPQCMMNNTAEFSYKIVWVYHFSKQYIEDIRIQSSFMQKQKINHVGMLLMNRCIFTHNMHLEITLLLFNN